MPKSATDLAENPVRNDAPELPGDAELVEAARDCRWSDAEALLASGKASARAKVESEGTWGAKSACSALHASLGMNSQGVVCVELARELLEGGADPNGLYEERDWRGSGHSETAFEMVLARALRAREAVMAADSESSYSGSESEDDSGGDVENKEEQIRLGSDLVGLVEFCFKAGADPNEENTRSVHSMRTDGTSRSRALHRISSRGDVELMRVLVEAGADVCVFPARRANLPLLCLLFG
jgi:hypothetical protein